ncbi:MAG: PQQ-dependent sugar dehydrogenase [Bacteroidota bacterium]
MQKTFSLFLLIVLVNGLFAQKTRIQTATTTHATQLNLPWDMQWWGNEKIVFTERPGTISRLDLSNGQVDLLHSVDNVAFETQSGLLALALHPNWPDSNAVYAVYNYYEPNFLISTRLEKLLYDAVQDSLIPVDTLAEGISGASTGTGARLLATADRFLYLTVGDTELGTVSQDSSSLNGKVLRWTLEGGIPNDNPIPNSPIFTFGHRNPQGMTEGENGRIYLSEHGTFNNDEINLLEGGRNYGWPQIAGFCDASNQMACDQLNMKEPLAVWTPPIAPSGMAFYGSNVIAEWNNSLLLANLRDKSLSCLFLSPDGQQIIEQQSYLQDSIGRIRDVLVSPDGRVFLCTSNRDSQGNPTADDDRILEVLSLGAVSIDAQSANWDLQWQWQAESLSLSFGRMLQENLQFELLSLEGKLTHTGQLPLGQASHRLTLPGLASGVYLLRLSSPTASTTVKLLVP